MQRPATILPTDPDEAVRVLLAVMVEHAGGSYVGVQPAVPELGVAHPLLLFNAPCGTTCAMRIEHGLSTDGIRRKIAEKEREFGRG